MPKFFDKFSKVGKWFIVALATGDENNEIINRIVKSSQLHGGMDIKLTINGEEFDFEPAVQAIDEACDSLVESRAKELAYQLALQKELSKFEVLEGLRQIVEVAEDAYMLLEGKYRELLGEVRRDSDD